MIPLKHIDATLKDNGVVILPTETVYGLAGRANSQTAIDKIYKLKGREFGKPLALCVRDLNMARKFGEMSPLARDLANHFWPGPLSIIVRTKPNHKLDPRVLGKNKDGHPTLSLRCPDSQWRTKLTTWPLALTSANRSGKPDTKTAKEAKDAFRDDIDIVLNGQDCAVGIASTIIAIENDCVVLLRKGSLEPEDFAPYAIDWVV